MTTQLIGQLLEVKPIEMEDRKTGKVKYSTDITISTKILLMLVLLLFFKN